MRVFLYDFRLGLEYTIGDIAISQVGRRILRSIGKSLQCFSNGLEKKTKEPDSSTTASSAFNVVRKPAFSVTAQKF